jgi:glyoxylase-like metal-dependent hydrolase (beta-lactamase superfamily II)
MLWKKKSGTATGTDLDVKRFVSKNGKNQYLLVSGNEAAAIDIAEAKDDVIDYLSQKAFRLKYLLITHAHPRHVQDLPELQETVGCAFCLHAYAV